MLYKKGSDSLTTPFGKSNTVRGFCIFEKIKSPLTEEKPN